MPPATLAVFFKVSLMKSVRSTVVCVVAAMALLPALATAQTADNDPVLAISEGTSGGTDHSRVIAKYADLAARMSQVTKQKIRVVFVREFAALEAGMKSGQFTYVMARPSDYPARGLRDHGYRYVASAKPDGRCMIYADKQSGIKTLEQAKGKKWAMPEEVAYMTRFCRAELRDQGIALSALKVQYVREQAAVKFYMDNGFADVGGVASYAGVRTQFEKDGAVLIHTSVAQPYFPLIASSKVTPAQVLTLQQSLVAMKDNAAGQAILKRIGIEAFDSSAESRLRDLNAWLEKK